MIHAKGYRATEELLRDKRTVLYRGRRELDGAPVVLKVLRTDYTRIADIARFKHEYGLIAQISSEHVLKVYGVEEHADGLVVIQDDFEGQNLDKFLKESGALGVDDFLELARCITQAVIDVHCHGLIHRDIRPHNILLRQRSTSPGRSLWSVKLADFGVDSVITRKHEAIYSPDVLADVLPYISPEQTGRMNRSIDYRTDLYSLGIVFYEMLTGQKPFSAEDPMELIHAHLARFPAPPSEVNPAVPAALSDVIEKLLHKTAEDRYHTAAGLHADLLECQEKWRRASKIDDFVAGQSDKSELFQIHQKLYGRQRDIEALVDAFERVLRGERSIALVSGYSGIGKSTLVQEILKPLARQRGYYISGKYDQYNRDMPYSAVLQAFDGLVRQILSESEARVAVWRESILRALGSNAQVICEVLPALEYIVGEQPPVLDLGPVESQNRFNLYFKRFVAVFARREHPLVLFLDDLQWIDSASLDLLKGLLVTGDLDSLFFCGAYRDNEVSPSHPFIMARDDLAKRGLAVRAIELAPLDLEHLVELIGDSLKTRNCGALAQVVFKKTGGNPFFVKQFIRSLYEQGVLVYDGGAGWQWDLPRIEALQYTENVVDLMVSAIQRLPSEAQEALKLAAAIGNRFDLPTLATVSESSPEEVYSRLDHAIEDGLIVPSGDDYRFAHDKIQEAAYSMIPVEGRPSFHYRIGTLLLSRLRLLDKQSLFDIVNHLNSAGDLIQDPAERLALARMSLTAAERAEESAAFGAALRFVTLGMERLPPDAWESHYALTLAYFKKKGVLQSLCDQHDAALDTLSACFERAQGRLDRTEVRRLKMNVQVLKNDLTAALDEGLETLRPFGIDLPPFPDDLALEDELRVTMAMLDEHFRRAVGEDPSARSEARMIEALVDLPPLEDPELDALQTVLTEIFSPCYFLASNNYGITVMKILQNTLRSGGSRSSIYGYVNFGVLLCARGDARLGYLFGRAAVRFNEVHPDKKSESMLYNMWGAFVQHWIEPYARCKDSLVRGMHVGVETGQYIWAFYNTVNSATNSLLSGVPLGDLLAECESYLPMWRLDKWNAITWMVGAVGQIAHNLQSPTPEPHRLSGSWIQIDPIYTEAERINSRASMFFAMFYQIVNGVLQAAYRESAEMCERTDPTIVGIASWHGNPVYHFYGGLAYSLAHDEALGETRSLYLRRAASFAEKLKGWAALCPENLRHRHLLLSAEVARLSGDVDVAGRRFEEGIAAAAEGGFVQDEALGSELCGRHYLRLGKTVIGRAYMAEAYRLYARWGATTAMARLEREHGRLLLPDTVSARPGPLDLSAMDAGLDMTSVLKASQAISGEIVLSRLLEKLLHIILENAGARRGVLVLQDEGELRVEAAVDIDQKQVGVMQGALLEGRDDLPVGVVQYVARTEESVVSGDATVEEQFAADPYIEARAPRSILATPILFQGRLAGVIYLENSLTSSVFTPARVETLRLLAGQAAISIENARVYAKLEEKVVTRTTELKEAHEQLMAMNVAQQQMQEEDLREKAQLIEQQRELIRALSSPIIQVWDSVLTVPIVGTLDDARALTITDNLLTQIVRTRSRYAILDLTGVDLIDTRTAGHLIRIVQAVRLLGAQGILTGIAPRVAQTMISLDLDMSGVITRANLREGLQACIGRRAAPQNGLSSGGSPGKA